MAGTVKNLMVRAGADFSAITKESNKAASSVHGMADKVSKSCSIMRKALGALGIGVSLAAIIRAGKAAAEAYDQSAEAEVKLARVMRNTMHASNGEIQSILDLASAQQELGIVGDEVQLAGAQELATYLSLSDSLQTLIPVMNDMAAQQYGYNVTAEQTTTIATMLGKVMQGQVGALSRYGYYFDDAQAKILKYGTEAERAAMLAEVVGQSVGGMNAALAATPTGRMRQLSNTLGDIKERFGQAVRTIGTAFLPLLNAAAKVLAAIATLANKVAQTIANVFGGTAAGKEWQFVPYGAAAEISDAADAADDLAGSTKKAAQAAQEAKNEFQLASFDTLDILREPKETTTSGGDDVEPYTPPTDSGGTGGIQEIDTGAEEAGDAIGWLEKLLGKVKETWEDFKGALDFSNLKESFGKLKEALSPLAGDLGKGLKWLYENVLKPLAAWTIKEVAPRVVELLANAFRLLHAVIEALTPVLEAIWPILKWLAELAGFLITAALDELNHMIEMMTKAISGNLTPLERFQVLLQTLAAITLEGLIGGLGGLATAAGGAAAAAGGLATAVGVGMGVTGAGGLLASLGAGSGAVGGFAASLTGTMVPALGAGTAGATTAAAAAGGLAAPIAAVVAVVVALGVAIYEVIKHWDEIKEHAGKAVDALKQAWSGISEWFKTKVSEPIIKWGKEAFENIRKVGAEAADRIREKWEGVKEWLTGVWDAVRSAGTAAWQNIQQFGIAAWTSISQTWGRAKTFFEDSIFDPLVASARSGVERIKSVFNGVAEAIGAAVQRIKQAIKQALDIADKFPSGFSLKNLSVTGLIDKLKSIKIPGLAEGAVIPPNRQFAAVLGDQSSGLNIETPERLLRQIMRDELRTVATDRTGAASELMSEAVRDGSSTGRLIRMLDMILDAIEDGHSITMDGYAVGRTTRRSMTMQARAGS